MVEFYIPHKTQNSKTNTTIVLKPLTWIGIYEVIVYSPLHGEKFYHASAGVMSYEVVSLQVAMFWKVF